MQFSQKHTRLLCYFRTYGKYDGGNAQQWCVNEDISKSHTQNTKCARTIQLCFHVHLQKVGLKEVQQGFLSALLKNRFCGLIRAKPSLCLSVHDYISTLIILLRVLHGYNRWVPENMKSWFAFFLSHLKVKSKITLKLDCLKHSLWNDTWPSSPSVNQCLRAKF